MGATLSVCRQAVWARPRAAAPGRSKPLARRGGKDCMHMLSPPPRPSPSLLPSFHLRGAGLSACQAGPRPPVHPLTARRRGARETADLRGRRTARRSPDLQPREVSPAARRGAALRSRTWVRRAVYVLPTAYAPRERLHDRTGQDRTGPGQGRAAVATRDSRRFAASGVVDRSSRSAQVGDRACRVGGSSSAAAVSGPQGWVGWAFSRLLMISAAARGVVLRQRVFVAANRFEPPALIERSALSKRESRFPSPRANAQRRKSQRRFQDNVPPFLLPR